MTLPSVMHLTEEYIDKGDTASPLSCPVALLLNDALEGDWTAYAGLGVSYVFPSRENAIKFDEYIDTSDFIDEMDMEALDMAIQLEGHKLVHEDRLRHWIREFDMGEDMYTCHIFAEGDGWLHMNRTGRNKQKENLND